MRRIFYRGFNLSTPNRQLQRVDLHKYAQQIRDAFEISDVPDSSIDYGFLETIDRFWTAIQCSIIGIGEFPEVFTIKLPETFGMKDLTKIREFYDKAIGNIRQVDLEEPANLREMVRRRGLLLHFIPDVFEPGRYNRRMDIIDGCIYFLERQEKEGQPSIVMKYWRKRAGVSLGGKETDYEESTFGHLLYHPTIFILGRTRSTYSFLIPKIVEWVRIFKGRKRKISLYDYYYWFFTTMGYAQDPTFALDDFLLQIIRRIQIEIEKVPFFGLDLNSFIETEFHLTSTQSRRYLTKFRKALLGVFPVYNRGAFGLPSYVFICPYPHYIKVFHRGAHMVQNLSVMGDVAFQQIWTVIPEKFSWNHLYAKFPQTTECYLVEWLPIKRQGAFEYFDINRQGWKYDWPKIKNEWKQYFEKLPRDSLPIMLNYPKIRPTFDLLRTCYILEGNALLTNTELVKHLKTIPLNKIKEYRSYLERTLATRVTGMNAFLDQLIEIHLEGHETWKYHLILKVSEIAPSAVLRKYTPLQKGKPRLVAVYALHPRDCIPFIRAFTEVFEGILDYSMGQYCNWARKRTTWYDLIDPETGQWQWDPSQFKITPINIHE